MSVCPFACLCVCFFACLLTLSVFRCVCLSIGMLVWLPVCLTFRIFVIQIGKPPRKKKSALGIDGPPFPTHGGGHSIGQGADSVALCLPNMNGRLFGPRLREPGSGIEFGHGLSVGRLIRGVTCVCMSVCMFVSFITIGSSICLSGFLPVVLHTCLLRSCLSERRAVLWGRSWKHPSPQLLSTGC